MRRFAVLLLVPIALGLCGCVISQQEGERTHVNSAYPEEVEFHFDTPFNKAVLFGRSVLLLAIAAWLVPRRGSGGGGGGMLVPLVIAGLIGSGSIFLLAKGWSKVYHYHIAVQSDELRLNIPSRPETVIAWSEIEQIDAEGNALDVRFGDGKGQAMKYASEWEDLTLTLRGGDEHYVDLRPLSFEQRGALWRAIARKAGLEVETWVEPG